MTSNLTLQRWAPAPPIPSGGFLPATQPLPPGVPPLPDGVTLDPPDDWQPVTTAPTRGQTALPPGVPPLPPGVTLDPPDDWQPVTTPPTWGQTAVDSAKGIGKGLLQGAAGVAGLVGDASTALNSGIDSAERHLGASPPALAPGKYSPTTQNISDATGISSLPDATTGIGKAAQNVAQFIPGALAPGGEGSTAAKLVKFGLAPGLASEGAGDLASAAGASPAVQGGARLAASLVAPGLTGRVVSPFQNGDAAHAANIAALGDEGVRATAGQAVDSKPMQYLEAQLTSNMNRKQANQFTQAAFNRVGMNVPDGMQPGAGGTVDQMLTDAGARYDGIAARNTLSLDPQGAQDLRAIHSQFLGTPGLYGPDTESAVRGSLNRVAGLLQQGAGTIPGSDYIALRSNLRAAARGADPQKAEGLNEVVNALDSAFERGLPPNSPDAGALPAANQNYRNALVLERAATAAGTQPASGNITPANLASAAKAVYGKRAYVRGQDPFSNLANPAVASLPPLPDSGTAHRAAVTGGLAALGGAAGYALGSKYNTDTGSESPIAGLLMGEAAGPLIALLGRPALMNPAVQSYLRNQAMTHTPGLLSIPGAMTAANGANGPRGLLSPGQ